MDDRANQNKRGRGQQVQYTDGAFTGMGETEVNTEYEQWRHRGEKKGKSNH